MKKLRVNVEGRMYEVEVAVLNGANGANGANGSRPHFDESSVPEAVLRQRPPHRMPEDSVCRSPMAGRIISIEAVVGRSVRRNEPVAMIEAMKMQVPISAAVDGIVKMVGVKAGQTVAAGHVLFELD